jgi:hypothetical protein
MSVDVVVLWSPSIETEYNVMSVADIPRWRMQIQVRINITVFVKIMDYSSVFHVLIDVL